MSSEVPTVDQETPQERGQDDAQACPECGGGMARDRVLCETCEALAKGNLFGGEREYGRSVPAFRQGRTTEREEDTVARDEVVEEAIDRASEEARNAPARRVDTAEDVAAREAARTQQAFERGRELNEGSPTSPDQPEDE